MEKVTVLAYKFNDLSPEAQDRAIDLNREIDLPYDLFDFDEDGYIEYANQKGFEGLSIDEYDLYRNICRLRYDSIDVEKILADKNIKHKSILIKIFKEYGYITWYRHTPSISYNWGPKDHPRVEKLMDLLDKILLDKTGDLESNILYMLKEEYDHLTSDSNIKEILTCNDYLFTSNGDPFRVEFKDVISRENIPEEEARELCKEKIQL